jgi:hypothetical protein
MSKAKNAAARQVIYSCCTTHGIPKVIREGRKHTREEAKKCVQRARDSRIISPEEFAEANRFLLYCPENFVF